MEKNGYIVFRRAWRGRAESSGERKKLQLWLGCRLVVRADQERPARQFARVEAQDSACSAYAGAPCRRRPWAPFGHERSGRGGGGVEACTAPIRIRVANGFSRTAVAIIIRRLQAARGAWVHPVIARSVQAAPRVKNTRPYDLSFSEAVRGY